MQRLPHVLSVNVRRPRTVDTGRRTVLTAIWKAPVQGRVCMRGVNLDGDDQADRSLHGGPDKAVYAYAIEETRAWEAKVGRELGPGAFGMDLALALVEEGDLGAGDAITVDTRALPDHGVTLRLVSTRS